MDTFSRPSITVAGAVLAVLALGGFAMGFKGSYSRSNEATPRYAAGPIAPQSGLGEPTTAKALAEPVPTSAAPPPSSAAAPKSATKPKPEVDDTDDTDDTAASARPARSAAPVKITPPPASAAPASNAAPASDAIGDLLPPH